MNTIDKDITNPLNPKHSPYLHHLKRNDLKWLVFGTVTFRREGRRTLSDRVVGAEEARVNDLKQLFKKTRVAHNIRGKNFMFYVVREQNLVWGLHYHFLIAENGIAGLNAVQLAKDMQHLWVHSIRPFDGYGRGIGEAKIKPYNEARELAGVKYCLELERDERGAYRDRKEYFSPALEKFLKKPVGEATLIEAC